jgi:DNA polymerase-1
MIFFLDIEFQKETGSMPVPLLAVSYSLEANEYSRFDLKSEADIERLRSMVSSGITLCAYYLPAEISCLMAMEINVPNKLLDLFVEYRWLRNGVAQKFSLLEAARYFGIASISDEEKKRLRQIAIDGPTTPAEKEELFEYCQEDVRVLKEIYLKMHTKIDWPRALVRGRYMHTITKVEFVGVPLDMDLHHKLQINWKRIRTALIDRFDSEFGFYNEKGVFKMKRFEDYLLQNDIKWPRIIETGSLKMDEQTFRDQCKVYPHLEPIRQLRDILGQMRLNGLEIGPNGRNCTSLGPFGSKTSRNQPSSKKFIFGSAAWLRRLVRPEPGKALVYLDYEQQEFGIAAKLSGDPNMLKAYRSADPYLTFGKLCGVLPSNANKVTHGKERDALKACVLGVQFGMGAATISTRIVSKKMTGKDVLELHKKTFPKYWDWSEHYYNDALLRGEARTAFGWRITVNSHSKERSIKNFPMQAHGADMLRFACILLDEAGIKVCATIHDAVVVEANVEELNEVTFKAKEIMKEASEIVLNGFSLRAEAKAFVHPQHYEDVRGKEIWEVINEIIN